MDSERLLLSYPALSFVRPLRRHWPGLSLLHSNLLLVIVCVVLLIGGSAADDALLLPRGVGMLEHPAIWIFFAGQALLPIMLKVALDRLSLVGQSELFGNARNSRLSLIRLRRDLGRLSGSSKSIYAGLAMLGLVAWLWNSYQNQLPYEFLGTDFWDSRLHPIGYWLTRAYKFYIWMFMIPMILHVQVVIIFRTNELLRRAKGSVQLQPFHPDRSGGASAIVRAVITPLLPSVLLGAALNFAVILVHGKIDPTTLGASIVFLATVTAFYLIPAKALRDLIAFEKRRQLELISRTQEVLYRSLLSTDGGPRAQEAVSRLSLLGDLAQRFDRLSLWPEGLRVAKAMASYVASPAAALIAKEAFAYAKQWIS